MILIDANISQISVLRVSFFYSNIVSFMTVYLLVIRGLGDADKHEDYLYIDNHLENMFYPKETHSLSRYCLDTACVTS